MSETETRESLPNLNTPPPPPDEAALKVWKFLRTFSWPLTEAPVEYPPPGHTPQHLASRLVGQGITGRIVTGNVSQTLKKLFPQHGPVTSDGAPRTPGITFRRNVYQYLAYSGNVITLKPPSPHGPGQYFVAETWVSSPDDMGVIRRAGRGRAIPKKKGKKLARGSSYECPVRDCELVTDNARSLSQHVAWGAHGPARFKCPAGRCPATYVVKAGLLHHFRREHPRVKGEVCGKCGEFYNPALQGRHPHEKQPPKVDLVSPVPGTPARTRDAEILASVLTPPRRRVPRPRLLG